MRTILSFLLCAALCCPAAFGGAASGGTAAIPVTISYTGNLAFPLVIVPAGQGIVVPQGSASGSQSYNPIAGFCAGGLVYVEGAGIQSSQALLTVTFTNLVGVGSTGVTISGPFITSISFPALQYVGNNAGFNISGGSITTLSMPTLAYIAGNFAPTTMAALTSLSAPALVSCFNFSPSSLAGVTTFNFPALADCCGNCAPSTMATLTTLSLPALVRVSGNFAPTTMAALTSLSCPALAYVGGTISAASMASLTTVNLSGLVNAGSTITFTSGLGAVSTVTVGTIGTTLSIGGNVSFNGQALTNASEDQILGVLASLTGSGGTTAWKSNLNIAGGTNAIPDSTGNAFIATIVANGGTVTHN